MENNWRMVMKMMMVVVVMSQILLVAMAAGPVLHKVGGSKGWTDHDVNYTQWSAQQNFLLNDWLLFNFDKRYFNVLEVNETSYEKCIDQGFIRNITKGGRDVVQLTQVKTYYFLSGGGYCFHGMKVAVTVHHFTPQQDAPAPSPADTSAASLFAEKHGIIPPSLFCMIVPFIIFWATRLV